MSLFAHWVAITSIAHKKVIDAAKAAALAPDGERRTAERELSSASVAFIQRLHHLEDLVAEFGVAGVFGTPGAPLGDDVLDRIRGPE